MAGVEIRPGDKVILPLQDIPAQALERLETDLKTAFPDVQWHAVLHTDLSHVLIYRDDATTKGLERMLKDAVAERNAMASKLETTLDLLGQVLGGFTEKGSIGAVDNVKRSGWINVSRLAKWSDWVTTVRDWLRERNTGL